MFFPLQLQGKSNRQNILINTSSNSCHPNKKSSDGGIRLKKRQKHYTGKCITFKAENIDANILFHRLADFSGYALRMDAKINKPINLKDKQLPWDQELDQLAQSFNLKAKILNSIIYVDTPVSLRKYRPQKKLFNGSLLSVNFYTINASHLFNVLADYSGNSLLIDANLEKKISIKRNNIPWDQILDEVAVFLNLNAKISNGIIYVDTPASLWKYKQHTKKYSGSPVTLNFLAVKIPALFKIIAESSGKSIVWGTKAKKKINKEISIRRNNIPWDQALDEISEFLDLKVTMSTDIIYIEEANNGASRKKIR